MGTESRESRTLSLNFQNLMHENLARDNHFQSKSESVSFVKLNLIKLCIETCVKTFMIDRKGFEILKFN